MLVDIHCHILPGIDDGAQTIDDSLDMARVAVSEGISHILCTPHYNNGEYMNKKDNIIISVVDLQKELDNEGIPLTLFEGQEIRISGDLISRLALDELLFADMSNRYLLIEFPFSTIPLYSKQVLFDLVSRGYTPVIVHPERNAKFMEDPNRLLPFLEMGCLTQVTCGSYLGKFGKHVKKAAEIMISHNMAHCLASDAHNTEQRGFYVKEAYALLEKQYGREKREEFEQTAKDIVNGDPVETLPVEPYKKKFKLFS